MLREPIDLPPIVSIELIQITDKTNIPFAPKAKKTIEKIKEKLSKIRPETLGQASRIDGVTPAALSFILAYIKTRAKSQKLA